MKKLLVISDTHECTGMLELLAQHIEENRYDMIIHLGDVRRDAEWLEERLGREIIGVAGNCDFFSRDFRELEIVVEKVKILLTHGDKYGVKSNLDRLSYYAEERGCQVALFGHTHQPFSGPVGKALLINPGTLMNGRFAVIDINGDKVVPWAKRV